MRTASEGFMPSSIRAIVSSRSPTIIAIASWAAEPAIFAESSWASWWSSAAARALMTLGYALTRPGAQLTRPAPAQHVGLHRRRTDSRRRGARLCARDRAVALEVCQDLQRA